MVTCDLFHGRRFILNGCGMPVGFHEENGFTIEGEADASKLFDAADGVAVEELEGAGDDSGRDDAGDGFGGVFHAGERGQHGAARGWAWDEAQQDFGDDAEEPFGADEDVFHGKSSDIFDATGAEAGDGSVHEYDFDGHDIVACDSVLEAAESAGIFAYVAADGADF